MTLLANETWQTHEVENQVADLADYNLFATDPALRDAVARAGADWAVPQLQDYAARIGTEASYRLAETANRRPPELHTFDPRGRRIDTVEFHPSWHALLGMYREQGFVSQPFREQRPGRWSAWAAGFYLHAQVELGTLCPATMTQASIPVLQKEEALWVRLRDKLYSNSYDATDAPIDRKASIFIGMGMTEKQGGSDVRANRTTATPVGLGGRGREYLLRGHKWFYSAPMSDAHLVVARTSDTDSLACFFVPRFRDDGTRNAILVQRLKDKVGNRSNSSSEVEFQDASGILLGEEGRGIPTIIEMATYTRLNCVIGSAAIMRQAAVQACHYAKNRSAFGRKLIEQPLMRTVLADLALESEAALALSMRLAQAFEQAEGEGSALDAAWKRIVTPAAKFWVCKRAVELTGEAMEVFGGNGYVEESIMARLFREAPVNSIWEGSGNVMCLDVLRALARDTDHMRALLTHLADISNGNALLTREFANLAARLAGGANLEAGSRGIAQQLTLLCQAALLNAHAPNPIADAFIATRLGDPHAGRVFGAIEPTGIDVEAVLERVFEG
ncbi:acyl-CoA dehydrogenase family protein [Roseiarcaceae bacterium H3SJ34-1]|uniref:acyl-CoA dehydrogenase family protein n=1 Tax=Terripilifer ovatus TaxID=3032367 RepID=UPI003AB92582|nr:acyl-CoA dehydrogenase family protein [Roseiarcaceae bacterium H3SJ34-1]